MDRQLAIRTIDRCEELGVFKMKCLKKFEDETWTDHLKTLIDILYDAETDDIPAWLRRYVLMTDEQFEFEKPIAKALVWRFDMKHRPKSVDPFEHLKLY